LAPGTVQTSWLGNTFRGGDKWVQNFFQGVEVQPDGTIWTTSDWDEGGRKFQEYKDGDVIGNVDHGIAHGPDQVVSVGGANYTIFGTTIRKNGATYITDCVKPTSMGKAANGQLMVTDDGVGRHVVRYYNVSGAKPVFDHNFGDLGGIGSGTPGLVTPTKFMGLTGCGEDRLGNIYITSGQEPGGYIRSLAMDRTALFELDTCLLAASFASTDF